MIMKHYVIYDDSGKILNRMNTSDPEQIKYYPNALEITREESEAQPEVYKKVNMTTMKLEDK